jgi:hypothetical protein
MTLSQTIDTFVQKLGLTGWRYECVASLIFVFICMLSVVVIGFLVNYLEILQMRGLAKVFGNKVAVFICNRLLFAGTVIHELSHAFFAFLSGAKVTKIRCFTLFSKDTLGYVNFQTRGGVFKRSFQLAFVSCAPTVTGCGFIALFLFLLRRPDLLLWQRAGLIYLLISVADHMSMSPQDIKNYVRGGIILFLVAFVFAVAFHHFL